MEAQPHSFFYVLSMAAVTLQLVLSSCDREHMAYKKKYLPTGLFIKSMLTPDKNYPNIQCIINFLVQKFTNSFNSKLHSL